MEFGSLEYLEEVKKRTNSDQKYLELAKEENASYTFIIEAEPEKSVNNTIILGYNVEQGKIANIWLGEKNTDFIISGKYGVWVDILLGNLGVTKAFLTRKLKVRGNLMKLLKLSKATEYWLEILRKIPTEFHGEYSRYNLKGE
ncbi:MAG: SCP2 sterol-binding domain-containing protein [Thermoprotei archaeon]